jgi:K+-sensing histidine kinase KdpD
MNDLVDLLKTLNPLISVPVLIGYGAVLFLIIKRLTTLKDERIAAAKEASQYKDERIADLKAEIEVLRKKEPDPNRLLAEVNLVKMSTQEKVEAAKQRLQEALEKLEAKESEVTEVRAAQDALLEELNRARERSEALARQLHTQRLDSERSELLRIQEAIMHEILSPVMAIVGHAEFVLKLGDRIPEEKRVAKLKSIISEGMLLEQLATSWRFRSRQDIHLSPTRTLLGKDIVFPALDAFRDLAQARRVRIEVTDFPTIPPVRLDADAFRQAIFNLVDNAIRYSHIDTAVKIHGRLTDGEIQIDIESQGISIPPQEVEHIFQVGYRSQDAQRHQPTGIGLGLPVAMKLIKAQGCVLSLLQTDPTTIFRISIPEQLLER